MSVMPPAPSFTAAAVSSTQINLRWNGVAGVTGYVVDEWMSGAWRQIGSFGNGSTGCTVTGLSPSTTYSFDVGAFNSAGTTWGNYQSATTPAANLTPPAAPSFMATAVSSTQINLAWSGVSGATGYLVDEWVNGVWRQIGSFGSGSTGCAVTGLSASTTYSFDVGAYNSAGATWANYQSATTSPIQNSPVVDHPAATSAYSPVSGSLFGPNGPSYLDVNQGAVGDCWLLASLAEVAARAPSDIKNMFTYNGTTMENGAQVGLYTVRLYSDAGTAKYISVDTELPAGGGTYDHPANGVLWVALAEKAYAQANGAGFVTTSNVGSDSYAALNEGDPVWALHAITGKSANDYSINPSNIAAAWNAGELVVLCSTANPANSYIVGSHAYALVGYNASSTQPFQVYNPWWTTPSGWAPGQPNTVYGLFYASGGLISQNYTMQSFGTGAADALDDHGDGWQEVAVLLIGLDHQWLRHSR
jgi:hypothetical protein